MFRKEFEKIDEVFKNGYEYKKESNNSYVFNVDNDVYTVYFKGKTMRTSTSTLLGIEVSFDKNNSSKIDKSKNPFKIFATIWDIMKDYNIKIFDYIEFSSEDKAREKVYFQLAKLIKKELKWEYMEEDDQGRTKYYIIYKKDPNV
jgi:hypothetical protein